MLLSLNYFEHTIVGLVQSIRALFVRTESEQIKVIAMRETAIKLQLLCDLMSNIQFIIEQTNLTGKTAAQLSNIESELIENIELCSNISAQLSKVETSPNFVELQLLQQQTLATQIAMNNMLETIEILQDEEAMGFLKKINQGDLSDFIAYQPPTN